MIRRPLMPFATLLAGVALVLTGCAGAPEPAAQAVGSGTEPGGDFPVTLTSCGGEVTVPAEPRKAVTLNQGATEVVLALGLEEQLAGTAYLDDEVSPQWAEAYDAVPVMSPEYPTNEQLLAAAPDFVYASYGSAFEPKVAGTQQDLAERGVGSYLSPFGCPDADDRPDASFEAVWQEVSDVATALGHPDRADELVDRQRDRLAELGDEAAGDGVELLWWDGGTKTPFVGAGEGGPQLVMDAVSATNLFEHVEGSWADGSWEDVLEADPDAIVLVDAAWDSAADKRTYLEADPVLSGLRAVRDEAYVVIPFSESTPGVRLVDGAASLGEQLRTLGLGG